MANIIYKKWKDKYIATLEELNAALNEIDDLRKRIDRLTAPTGCAEKNAG